jgi:hypothetical protein
VRRFVLLIKKSSVLTLKPQYGILLKGVTLPPGSIRVWGDREYIKFGPGDWRLKEVSDKTKRPASLKDHIHTILHGTPDEKEALKRRYFYLADTPQFMKELEPPIRGEYFATGYGAISHHKRKDDDHNLTEQEWIELCEAIKKPFVITKYEDGHNLFTEILHNGKPVMVGVMIKPFGMGIEINAIRTAFAIKSVKGEKVIYQSKKITPEQAAFLGRTNSANSRLPEVRR